MLMNFLRRIERRVTTRGGVTGQAHTVFNRTTHRVVPKNSSVYDPSVFGKYDLKTQRVIPKAEAGQALYNFDSILQFAQRHRADGRSRLLDDRIRISLGYLPKGEGTFLDACTPQDNPIVRAAAEDAGYQYVPIDIRGDGKTVLREDLCALSLDAESVSLIFSVDTLEHIQDVDQAIAQMRRVLRSDGVLIVHVPAYFFARPDSPDIDACNDPYGHVRYFSGPDLVNRLFEGGLIPLRIGFNLDYGAAVVCATKNADLWNGL